MSRSGCDDERRDPSCCRGLLAWACDRPEIDPASALSPHPAHPSHAQSSRRASADLRHSGTPDTFLVRDPSRVPVAGSSYGTPSMDRPRPTNCVRTFARQRTTAHVSARQAPVGEVKGRRVGQAPPTLGWPRDSSGWLDGVVNCLHAAHAVLEDERVDGVLRLAAASDR